MIYLSDLNKNHITWLFYLASLKTPCGIINNNTDKIIWTNNCSDIKTGQVTTTTHVNKTSLLELKEAIERLDEVTVEDRYSCYYSKTYQLQLENKILEVNDYFYKMIVNEKVYRIFEQIKERTIAILD